MSHKHTFAGDTLPIIVICALVVIFGFFTLLTVLAG